MLVEPLPRKVVILHIDAASKQRDLQIDRTTGPGQVPHY